MNQLLTRLRQTAPVSELFSAINNDQKSIGITGIAGSLGGLIAALLLAETNRMILYISSGVRHSETILDDISGQLGTEQVGYYPPVNTHPFETVPLATGPRNERTEALLRLKRGLPSILVVQPETLIERSPDIDWIDRHTHRFIVGETADRNPILLYLTEAGYQRESLVSEPGQFAVRGGILDIFPYGNEKPLRMEFDGDQIADLRYFEPTTQRSSEPIKEALLLIGSHTTQDVKGDIFSLIPPNSIILWDDQDETKNRIQRFFDSAKRATTDGLRKNALQPEVAYLSFSDILERANNYTQVVWLGPLKRSPHSISFGATHPDPIVKGIDIFQEYLPRFKADYELLVTVESTGEQERLQELLLEVELENAKTILTTISSGFVLKNERIAVLTSHELFGRRRLRSLHTRFRRKMVQFDREALRKGDYVVHVTHGIGMYEGLQMVKVRDNVRECLRIRYQDNALLYIPVESFQLVEKFSGTTPTPPKVSRLGSGEWDRIKKKTKSDLQDIADELITLYAQRKITPGVQFAPDTTWQYEMEDSFEFEDTPDQIIAVEEIKKDLESPFPMDRLLSGDVGFGKTEVAVRAAFKVIQDGFQVAVLVPTTILAQQHLETFKDRLAFWPVTVEMLSRFRTKTEQKSIIEKVKTGGIDIIIGTHRLLSKDVKFKQLGLVVIDEEHRFGVKHKEKLKEMTTAVDVLSMTATPIPRTLHLALMGARDTSKIETPPVDRLPIQTEVYPFSTDLIKEAILKEMDRDGQVFFLHNRIESIYGIVTMLNSLLPDLRVAVGHGRLPEDKLERVMLDFMNHQYDVLVCTTIIESGIDIPNVNTLIVNRADKLGLAQLYQIRGRIGRSNRQAYAYLLTPPMLVLTPVARQRLATLTEFTELGSGMNIALKDLEIRGAGNLLGAQQSGYINAVGFDMYTRLLEEAITEIKGHGEPVTQPKDTLAEEVKVEFPGAAFITNDYIDDGDIRYQFYRKLAHSKTIEEVNRIEAELMDRFGVLPRETRNLMGIVRIKLLSRLAHFSKVVVEKRLMTATLKLPSNPSESQSIIRGLVVNGATDRMEFKMTSPISLIYHFTSEDTLREATIFLQKLT